MDSRLARSEQFGEEKNAIEQEKQEAAKGPAKSALMGRIEARNDGKYRVLG
jgi:hypothetical protein